MMEMLYREQNMEKIGNLNIVRIMGIRTMIKTLEKICSLIDIIMNIMIMVNQ